MFNWAENFTYSTDRVHQAGSVEEIRRVLKAHQKVKVLGTRHCFNSIADSGHNFLSLTGMQEMTVDTLARTVTVGPGVTYGLLGPYLDSQGFALPNLASLPHISVVGACATGTHGSGETTGNLSTAVSTFEMVTADGEVVTLARDSGGVVGLGALGVITRITLDIEPSYTMSQYVYEDLSFDQVRERFDEIQASGYSVCLFTDWRKPRMNELWIKTRHTFDAPAELFGAKLADRNLHPIAQKSAENCTQQMGVPGPWYDRLPHFRMGYTPSAGKELQSEYFVPRRHAVEAILALERLRDVVSPLLMITEIRTIAADELWMSPCYGRDSVAIHFTWRPDWPAVRQVLPLIERELGPFGPRPHWGKLFTMAPRELRSRYERLPDFVELAKRYDPAGKFRNEFLDTNLFAD